MVRVVLNNEQAVAREFQHQKKLNGNNMHVWKLGGSNIVAINCLFLIKKARSLIMSSYDVAVES